MLVPAHAMAQKPAASPPPCSGPQYRTLDFWVGDWIAEWDNPDGTRATGANRITRDQFGACAIVEHFTADDASLIGGSVSAFVPAANRWRQTWVDNQGGYIELEGGPAEAAPYAFVLETRRLTPSSPYQRMIWEAVRRDGFTWRWQSRSDPQAPWADSWVIRYRRKIP